MTTARDLLGPVTGEDPVPTCVDPSVLPLVDASYERPGSDASHHLANFVCPRCPVAAKCLDWAMDHHEQWGVWGGLTPKRRARARNVAAGASVTADGRGAA